MGIGLLLATGIAIAARYDWLRERPARSAGAILGIVAAALVAVVGWQVDRTVEVQAVFIEPVPQRFLDRARMENIGELPEVAHLYFGETDTFVYLQGVRSAIPNAKGGYRVNVCGEPLQIVELRRDEATLRFAADKVKNVVENPGSWLIDKLTGRSEDTQPQEPLPSVCSSVP